jgi:hypothetical protein
VEIQYAVGAAIDECISSLIEFAANAGRGRAGGKVWRQFHAFLLQRRSVSSPFLPDIHVLFEYVRGSALQFGQRQIALLAAVLAERLLS